MSPPDYFGIEYSINPWMNLDNAVDKSRSMSQWTSLKSLYQSRGVTVDLIPAVPGLPDLVFTTDHGTMIDDTFYLSNFRYAQRQSEQNITIPWYQSQSIKLQSLPSRCYMEGGDVVFHHNHIYLGYGFRTSHNTGEYLAHTTSYPITAIELVDEAFYHLDTCFFPLSDEVAFYYPAAFSATGIKSLKSRFDLLLPLTSHEAEGFACNSVVLDDAVVCQSNPTFEQKLLDLHYSPITLDMREFNKSGGGIHCLSQILA